MPSLPKYTTPYESFLDWDFQGNHEFVREENISTCWNGSISIDINLASTENITSGLIKKHPICFIPFSESMLRIRYSILIKQYALNKDSYRFWENLKESNESTGSLYDAQPFQIVGNIKNIQDPTEAVLGYFDMATVSSKRIFIKKTDDIPFEIKIPTLYPNCLVEVDTIVSYDKIVFFLGNGYLISRYIFGSGYEMVLKNCIDCRLKGGTNIKPEFWE